MRFLLIVFIGIISVSSFAQPDKVVFQYHNLEGFKAMSKAEGKPYYIDFWASWCVPCKKMDKTVFSSPQVAAVTERYFNAYKVNIDSPEGRALCEEMSVKNFPTVLFFTPEGELLGFEPGMFTPTTFYNALMLYHKLNILKEKGGVLPHTLPAE